MSSIRIQYTTDSPPATVFKVEFVHCVSCTKGGFLSALAAFSAVAILFGKNSTSLRVFFMDCAPVLTTGFIESSDAALLSTVGLLVRLRLTIMRRRMDMQGERK